jgi:hypothetical protein
MPRNTFKERRKRTIQLKTTKTLVKGIGEDTSEWKDSFCLWMVRVDTLKMFILLNVICRFNAIPIKIPMSFFTELGKNNLKIYMEP